MVNRYICTSCGLFRRFDRPAWSIKTFGAALLALTAVVPAPHCPVAAKYPQEALLCLASLKEPDGELICPEHRFVIEEDIPSHIGSLVECIAFSEAKKNSVNITLEYTNSNINID